MTFAVPAGLAPELYPLAWLVGTWRGPGVLGYPEIPERRFQQEVRFDHDGGPYLAYVSTMWLLDGDEPAAAGSDAVDGAPATVWSAESGYWRPRSERTGDADARTELEVLIAEPTGHVSIYLGAVRGPRIEIATDLVARTSTAVDVSAAHRMYGLVDGELMWALDLAALGHDLQPYASARLARLAAPTAEEAVR